MSILSKFRTGVLLELHGRSRLFFPSLAFLNQKRAGTETVDREMLEAHIHIWSHLEWNGAIREDTTVGIGIVLEPRVL